MFVSFFPKPKLFFISALAWGVFLVILWFSWAKGYGASIGFGPPAAGTPPLLYPTIFLTPEYLWFYAYFAAGALAFYLFWKWYSPHPWQNWSILVSALILFNTNFAVQVSVVLNTWRGVFYDMIQRALTPPPGSVSASDLFSGVVQFILLAGVYMTIAVLNIFVVRHFIFRWRTAMHDYFTGYWQQLRHIEGASQRVQDDTMRFSQTMQGLGIRLVDAIMTLIAFLPLLAGLSVHVTELPFVGAIPYPLVIAAVCWSVFGTVLLAIVGIKLPGLEFKNQRVEAALRKELVYGEDDETRADPITLKELFANVRKNYFRLYAHYVYFDVTRYLYLQTDNVFALLILTPTIAAGKITFGIFQQIVSAFTQVADSFQYLIISWPTIVELLSIYKRLRAFEAVIGGESLPEIDQKYLKRKAEGAEDAEIAT